MHIALVGAEMEENLAVRYIRGALEQAGHAVTQVVFNAAEETERAALELADSGAELAGFSMVFTYRAREFAALATRARELGFRGHTVAGGHFAAFNAETLLSEIPAFDSVAVGEGEQLMCSLAASLGDPAAVAGLVWRGASGKIVRNPPAVKQSDLDSLPYPARKQPPDTYLGLPVANMLSSRGCTHACSFCSIAAWHRLCGGERFRARSPENVAAEISSLYRDGYRIFNFHDDNFFPRDTAAALDRMQHLQREMGRRAVGRIAFAVKSRPDSVDRDLFAFMKEMGLFRAFVGIEAGTADSLRRLGRNQTIEINEQALEIVNSLDLHACFNMLLLNPDSTLEDFQANVAFLRKHPRNAMNFCRTEIYSGTPLHNRLARAGRIQGSCWGYGYCIGDPRAQRAFEIMHAAMYDRHHTDDNLHHLTMKVDYERQLLAHFFECSDQLRQKVKGFIEKVNLNSCDYLDEVAEAAGHDFSSEAELERVAAGIRARLLADNRELTAQGERILAEIRRAAWRTRCQGSSGWTQKAAAVGLAATLTVATGSTASGQLRHMCEMAARPARPFGVQRYAESEIIRAQVQKDVLPRAAAKLDKPQDITIFLRINADGSVSECHAALGTPVRGREEERFATLDLRNMNFKQPKLSEGFYRVSFTAAEVQASLKQPAGPPDGDPALLRADFESAALRYLAQRVQPARDIEVELWVDEKGAVSFGAVYKGGVKRATAGLNDDESRKAAQLIKDLGAERSSARKAATDELKRMGRGVLPLVRSALAQTDDPEVSARCRDILNELEQVLDVPAIGEVLRFLRSLSFTKENVRGKRFVLAVPASSLEQNKTAPPDTHIFEVAPAPLD